MISLFVTETIVPDTLIMQDPKMKNVFASLLFALSLLVVFGCSSNATTNVGEGATEDELANVQAMMDAEEAEANKAMAEGMDQEEK